MRKGRVDRADHDAERAVHLRAAEQRLQHALVAEPLDERDRRQQRRREDRCQSDDTEQPFGGHARAGQRIGEREGERNRYRSDDRRDGERVPDRLAQPRRREIVLELQQPDEDAVLVLHALHENHRERPEQEHHERRATDHEEYLREPVLPVQQRLHRRRRCRRRSAWRRGVAIDRRAASGQHAQARRRQVDADLRARCEAACVDRLARNVRRERRNTGDIRAPVRRGRTRPRNSTLVTFAGSALGPLAATPFTCTAMSSGRR